jgi:DNA-formamidopyrimidine glycosylase
MPEGVEAKIMSEIIKPLIVNKEFNDFIVCKNSRHEKETIKLLPQLKEDLKTKKITVLDVNSTGKLVYFKLSNNLNIISNLGMTGQWSKNIGIKPSVELIIDNKSLYFNDLKHFGKIEIKRGEEFQKDIQKLGWDPLNEPLESRFNFIVEKLQKSKVTLAVILLNQDIFNGIGNYIRTETLYRNKISPWKITKTMSSEEIADLCNCIKKVMEESYDFQIKTLSPNEEYGEGGGYDSCYKIYNKDKDPFGNEVIAEKMEDRRTIYWCPNVQKDE